MDWFLEGLGWFAQGVPSEPKAGFDRFGVDTGTVAYQFELLFIRCLSRAVDKGFPYRCRFVT